MTQAPAAKPPPTEATPVLQIGFVPPISPRESRRSPAPERGPADVGSTKPTEDANGPFFSLPREDGSRLFVHVQDAAKLAALAQALATRALAEKVMPSESEWTAMRDTYLAKIHPIFPLFDRSMLLNLPHNAALRELIQATVCLAAATDPDSSPCLTFKTSTEGTLEATRVSYDEYSHAVAGFIKSRLTELQEAQEIPLIHQIQVMALTCLYWQPASRTERWAPMDLFARLASLVHTHGIHLGILPRGQGDGDCGEAGRRLFKCLYTIDRLIAAIAARPLLFHNIDIMQVPRPEPSDPPIFRLFLSLILLLDQVFEMYRPRPTISYVDLPVFEGMAIEAGAQSEPETLLATLEVLYHAIGVLSVRMPRHRFRTAPECDALHSLPTQHLPPSSVNARRSHSADRILDVLENYKLSPVPFVPYASTLSLSVAYRKWRFSRLPMFRCRGGADFKRMLPIVQRLGAVWGSARINAQLGQTVVRKLDQIESNRKKAKAMACSDKSTNGAPHAEDGTPSNALDKTKDGIAQPGSSMTEQAVLSANAQSTTSSVASTQPSGQIASEINAIATALNPKFISSGLVPTTLGGGMTQQSVAPASSFPPPAYRYRYLDDAIPLPGDVSLVQMPPALSTTSTRPDGAPAGGLPGMAPAADAQRDEFLVDDDVLFQEWDPLFAQSVDFSFSSLLDPGNPFAWPEYGEYV
jgi:hypothetical protein